MKRQHYIILGTMFFLLTLLVIQSHPISVLAQKIGDHGWKPENRKEVGTGNLEHGGSFVPQNTLYISDGVPQEGWIRIQVQGAVGFRRDPIDVMLAIDRTGSMSYAFSSSDSTPKMDAAKTALDNFITIIEQNGTRNDRMGLVSFASNPYFTYNKTYKVVDEHPDSNDDPPEQLGATLDWPLEEGREEPDRRFEKVKQKVQNLNPSGGTPLGAGLSRAIKEFWEAFERDDDDDDHNDYWKWGRKRVLVFASDGAQTVPPSIYDPSRGETTINFPGGYFATYQYDIWPYRSRSDLVNILKIPKDYNVKVYTIGIGEDMKDRCLLYTDGCNANLRNDPSAPTDGTINVPEDYLKVIASATGGKYSYAGSADDLQQIYEDIANEITFSGTAILSDYINTGDFDFAGVVRVTTDSAGRNPVNYTVLNGTQAAPRIDPLKIDLGGLRWKEPLYV